MAFPSSSKDRRSRESAHAALVPALIGLVLIVGAVEVAILTKQSEPTVAQEPAARNPFADMPQEAPPPPREAPPASKSPPVPDNVANDPEWLAAKLLAADARELYEAALAAKASGDLATASAKGRTAREKYDRALESTAVWEEELLSKYDPRDSALSAIHDMRSDWLEKLVVLEKSFGPR